MKKTQNTKGIDYTKDNIKFYQDNQPHPHECRAGITCKEKESYERGYAARGMVKPINQ